jgi:hypothetical protein
MASNHTYNNRTSGTDPIGFYPLTKYNIDALLAMIPRAAAVIARASVMTPTAGHLVIYEGNNIVGYTAYNISAATGSLDVLALFTIDVNGGYDLIAIDHLIDIAISIPGIGQISIDKRDGDHIDKYMRFIMAK